MHHKRKVSSCDPETFFWQTCNQASSAVALFEKASWMPMIRVWVGVYPSLWPQSTFHKFHFHHFAEGWVAFSLMAFLIWFFCLVVLTLPCQVLRWISDQIFSNEKKRKKKREVCNPMRIAHMFPGFFSKKMKMGILLVFPIKLKGSLVVHKWLLIRHYCSLWGPGISDAFFPLLKTTPAFIEIVVAVQIR